MKRRARFSLVLALALLAFSRPARAVDDTQARYERGIQLYRDGRFDDAAREFKAAYEGTGSPALLFNLGQCYRQLGDRTSAIASYRAYLHQLPDAANRADVEERLRELEAASFARPAAVASASVPADRGRVALIAGIAALGLVGTSCLAGAGALSLRAENDADALRDTANGTRWTEAQASRYDDGRRATGAAIGLYVVGGVTLAASATTAIVFRKRLGRDRRAPSSSVATARATWGF